MKVPTSRAAPYLLIGVGALLTFTGSATATNLVTGKHIQDNTVTSKDLRNASLQGVDVEDLGLTQEDVSQQVLGTEGAPGEVGPTGISGSPGDDGFDLVRVVQTPRVFVENEKGHRLTAYCPDGTKVLSGGIRITSSYIHTRETRPLDGGTGWTVNFYTAANVWGFASAYAICAHA